MIKALFFRYGAFAVVALSLGLGAVAAYCQTAAAPSASAQKQVQVTPQSLPPGSLVLAREDWVYYLAPGARQPRKLAPGRYPALSPDGARLAYGKPREDRGGAAGLVVLDLASGQTQTVVNPGPEGIFDISWSPDGRRLAFLNRGDQDQVEIVNSDGSGRAVIARFGTFLLQPVWAPDGQSLYFHDLHTLFQVNLTGQVLNRILLTDLTGKAESISSMDRFAPNPVDPQLWAFTMGVKGTPKFERIFHEPCDALFLFDFRTKKRVRLTPPDMMATRATWSRDGNFIYFSGYREPHYKEPRPFRIYRIGKDGRGLTEITRGERPSP